MNANRADLYTSEQADAIRAREVSVALSAGAGCGKTFVLTERFLDLFDPHAAEALRPEQIGQLIAITFTDRAAREMRDRIRKKCYQRLRACDPADSQALRYWTSLLRFLDHARVSTIHAFCSSLLRSHAVEAELDPQFGVLEQSEAETLLSELIDDVIRNRLAEKDADTLELFVRYSLDQIRTIAASLVSRRERSEFESMLEATADDLLDAWTKFFETEVPRAVLSNLARGRHASRLLRLTCGQVSSQALMVDRCSVIREKLERWRNGSQNLAPLAAAAELDELHEAAMIKGSKDWVSDEIKEAFGKSAGELRKQIKASKELLAFDREAARTSAEFSLRALRLSADVARQYSIRKQELAKLDFDDLLIAAHRLLTAPVHKTLQDQLSGQLRLLLVDEFQDTDPLQVELVKALCGNGLNDGKLFFVGDLKQSIYRFRGAKPQVFVDLQAAIPARGRLPLSQNFRSQPEILHFVNALFVGELTEEYRPLVPHRKQVTAPPAVEFLWAPAGVGDAERPPDATSNSVNEVVPEAKESVGEMRSREAEWIARRLRTILDVKTPLVYSSEQDKDSPVARAARPGDIAILFRALSDVEVYEKALQKYEIPYYLVGGHAFYAQQEIFDLVNLLRSIASPADSISLAGVLRSPFFSLADETLYQLSQLPGGITEAIIAPVTVSCKLETEKVRFASQTMQQLRGMKNLVPVAELIQIALEKTGYDAALLAEFLGERKLANLNKLIDQARSFDRSGLFTLEDFIEQLSRFVAKEPKEPFAAVHPEAGDVVRLMTIHTSKGLEFPIVVVPDLERNSPGGRELAEYHSKLGPLVSVPELPGESDQAVGGLDLFKIVSREEDEQESRRLLYVATTRAADYLMLSSSIKELGKPGSSWMELLSRHFDLVTGELVGELPQGWEAPTVLVNCEPPPKPMKEATRSSRSDLEKVIAKAEFLVAENKAGLPASISAIAPNEKARRQFSFSRLTGKLQKDVPEETPMAAAELVLPSAVLDPLGLGTLVHAALAEIDFSALENDAAFNVSKIVERHVERHVDEPNGELEEAVEMLERLVERPLSRRLATAQESYVELEFLLAWPPENPKVGCPYLRGFIDRAWKDQKGDWHLLDFKTNYVTAGNVATIAGKYEMQMLVYALAAEQVIGVPPRSLTLHFLRTGDEFTFDWNTNARQRVLQMVNAAIAAAANSKLTV